VAELTEAITLWEAFKFLGPLVGGGGITAIAVAYFGSRRPQLPQKADPAPSVGISALLADHLAMERFTTEIRRLADAAEDISKVGGRLADMMDIAAAVERLTQTKQKG
jgi:hypothetical protein